MTNEVITGREHALELLKSPDAHVRYLAAKALIKFGIYEDLKSLMVARKNESDGYAQKWIDLAIGACDRKAPMEPSRLQESDDLPETNAELLVRARSQAIDWVAGVLLHEIGSKIGLLGGAVKREIANYEQSTTALHIDNLEKIFEGVTYLRIAAAAPQIKEFDLAALIKNIVEIEKDGIDISLVGRAPLLIFGDQNLLRLALCNGIRNAVEAVKSVANGADHQIVINWEITDKEYWIVVLDHGPGIVGPVESLFEIARSTKRGHAGFGLAIARQAMERLGGTVTLSPSTGGGATYEIKGALSL
ncbi:ATP-binding protein [uncultured Herbaspirillum sp.]|uniref:sensor histidine kinase n=1 Tax=uncultured Herbaspirillum sp. TaxID=160236 RepID=UPI002636EA92|nr:ATP-binding protein [uncultured Herbaspirillum sp.]